MLRSLDLTNADTIFRTGIAILKSDAPETLLEGARVAVERHPRDPRMHQLLGLTARALGLSGLARDAFAKAASLAPADPLIAHSHARAALEAGDTATDLFDGARQLAPMDGSLLLGRAAAQIADGQFQAAIDDLAAIVEHNPLWLEGQRTLARLRGQYGLDPAETILASLKNLSRNDLLHREHIVIQLEARNLDAADDAVRLAMKWLGEPAWLQQMAGHVASERGAIETADQLFEAVGGDDDIGFAAQRVRHLIRANRPDVAAALIDRWIDRDADRLLWPYRALARRMLGDPRESGLEGDEAFVQIHDLADMIGDLSSLAEYLRQLHMARTAPLDQSVRGGTQTDGNLLLRDDARIRHLRSVLLDAVKQYVDGLPPPEPGHPLLIGKRRPIRIAGSWSVRLSGKGFHTDHVHSQGWISSALYIALPHQDAESAAAQEGWLSLGTARDLVPDLAPARLIEPRPGRLVLFPSTMWHGTRPFSEGERLTVAFDIARPKQG